MHHFRTRLLRNLDSQVSFFRTYGRNYGTLLCTPCQKLSIEARQKHSTKENKPSLKRYHVRSFFHLCHSALESAQYLFTQCEFSKLVCFSPPSGFHILANTEIHDWLINWLLCCTILNFQLMCMILWKIWHVKNQFHF